MIIIIIIMRKKPRPPYLFTSTLSFCVHLAPARINDHLSALRGGGGPRRVLHIIIYIIIIIVHTRVYVLKWAFRRGVLRYFFSSAFFIYYPAHLVFYFIARRILNYNVLCHSKRFIRLKSTPAPSCTPSGIHRGKVFHRRRRRDARLFSKLSHPSKCVSIISRSAVNGK